MVVNRFLPAIADEDLLAAFANLGHVGPDELDDPEMLRAWWVGLDAEVPAQPITAGDLELLRASRATVRGLALANNGVVVDIDGSALEAVPLSIRLGDQPDLAAQDGSGLAQTLVAAVATALVRASARPGWSRLKACPGPDCAWVFRDQTRNGSRRWCLMSECGNRAKGAAFRARAGQRH